MDDTSLRPVNSSWHAPIQNVVYHGMDWLCPGYSKPLHDQLASLHGTLTPSLIASHVVPIVQTGDLHVAVYDLTPSALSLLTSNAAAPGEAGPKMAYDRPFVQVNVSAAFALARPAS